MKLNRKTTITLGILVLIMSILPFIRVSKKIYNYKGELICITKKKLLTGLPDGTTVELFRSGDVFIEANYDNGKLDGNYLIFHINRDTLLHVEYKEGMIWNIFSYNSIDGEKLDYGEFSNGNGKVTVYYFNGTKHESGSIVDGYREGPWHIYSNKKDFFLVTHYEKGVDKNMGTIQNKLLRFHPNIKQFEDI